jgi:hypothetical protein
MKRMINKPKAVGTPKLGWASEPNTPRTSVRFATNGSKYRKDDANTAGTSSMTLPGLSALRNGLVETGMKPYVRQYPSSYFRSSRKAADFLRWASLRLMKKKPTLGGGKHLKLVAFGSI